MHEVGNYKGKMICKRSGHIILSPKINLHYPVCCSELICDINSWYNKKEIDGLMGYLKELYNEKKYERETR